MDNHREKNKRRYERYDAEARVYFRLIYDVRTKVKFQILDKRNENRALSQKYIATCRNVSTEGLCFISNKVLKKGDFLYLELYMPTKEEPIQMEGQVRWSQAIPSKQKYEQKFDTGVKLATVDGKSVLDSIHHDGTNQIVWSSVLESVFGDFRKLMKKRYTAR